MTTLTIEALKRARETFSRWTGPDGEVQTIRPGFAVLPPPCREGETIVKAGTVYEARMVGGALTWVQDDEKTREFMENMVAAITEKG